MNEKFDLRKFVTRQGRRIEVGVIEPTPTPKKRKQFKVQFIKFPESWAAPLEKLKSAAAWQLACRILREAYIQTHTQWPKPMVLSKKMTGLPRTSRHRATDALVRGGLIRIKRDGRRAVIVTELLTTTYPPAGNNLPASGQLLTRQRVTGSHSIFSSSW